jgi:hypothetical protein
MRWACVILLLLCGCVDTDPPALRTLVTVVATQEGQPVVDATRSLVAAGRPALVVVEAALHTADAAGRKRLIRVLDAIADPDGEGSALLAHLSRYDEDAEVRAAAEQVLTQWAAQTQAPRRAEAAKRDLDHNAALKRN